MHPKDYIESLGALEDAQIDLAVGALALAALDQPEVSIERFLHHLKTLSVDVAERHLSLLGSGARDDAGTQLAALKHVISDQHGYLGEECYGDLETASLIRVIDRAKGGSDALAILYIHAARNQGWGIEGLRLPGRLICRLQKGAERILFDPFEACRVVGAPELRAIVKQVLGLEAELLAEYYEPASNREILIRQQNAIKYKRIEREDYQGALDVVERMRQIDPQEYRLLLDAGVLYAKLEQPARAIQVLNQYIQISPDQGGRREAELLLYHLQEALN